MKDSRRSTKVFRVAQLWTGLMNELGYKRFAAQGGDPHRR
jgi:hypothetical protein